MLNTNLIANLKKEFQLKFNQDPIIIASPGRINLIGEHTDYNNGFVMPAAIDKKVFCAIAKNNTSEDCIVQSLNLNDEHSFKLSSIRKSDTKPWANYIMGVVDIINKKAPINKGLNIMLSSNVPLGAGLSSSAALENAISFGVNELFNLGIPKEELIYISQKAEHTFADVECGIMDQYSSAFGKTDQLLLLDCKSITSKDIPAKFEPYELWLFNTNVSHNLAESEYNVRRKECREAIQLINENYKKIDSFRDLAISDLPEMVKFLPETLYKRASYVVEENDRVIAAAKALKNNDLELFGELLYKAHEGQQNKYEISCKELDFMVDFSKSNDKVIGSRMMGGGFGGCTINLIHQSESETYTESLKKAYKNAFNIDLTPLKVKIDLGTHII